jgi:hypothetical protein
MYINYLQCQAIETILKFKIYYIIQCLADFLCSLIQYISSSLARVTIRSTHYTLGIVKRIFEVTRARLSFPFVWMPWKLTQDYNRQCLLVQTFCTNSVEANRMVAATNQNGLYKKHMFCRKNVNKIKMRKIVSPARFW